MLTWLIRVIKAARRLAAIENSREFYLKTIVPLSRKERG